MLKSNPYIFRIQYQLVTSLPLCSLYYCTRYSQTACQIHTCLGTATTPSASSPSAPRWTRARRCRPAGSGATRGAARLPAGPGGRGSGTWSRSGSEGIILRHCFHFELQYTWNRFQTKEETCLIGKWQKSKVLLVIPLLTQGSYAHMTQSYSKEIHQQTFQ